MEIFNASPGRRLSPLKGTYYAQRDRDSEDHHVIAWRGRPQRLISGTPVLDFVEAVDQLERDELENDRDALIRTRTVEQVREQEVQRPQFDGERVARVDDDLPLLTARARQAWLSTANTAVRKA